MKNIVKQASLEARFDLAYDSIRDTAKKLETVTVRADMRCDELNFQIKKLEEQIAGFQEEMTSVEKLRATAYAKMIAINGLLGE